MIQITDVTKRYGRARAVDGVTLDIPPGDSVALWGANGAGKTTLIRCALGLLRFRGKIAIGPYDVRRQGKRARVLVGYVPQELGFYDDLGVAEAVVFFARLKGLSVRSTGDALGAVGLGGHGRKRIRELSGGMKQRLALAIATLGDPPVLVLDEVTASLDACGRQEFVSLLSRLSGEGRTMLFASHRIEEVATLARRVVVLDRGRVASVEATPEFVRRQEHGTTLHLTLAAGVRHEAMGLLRASGFAPRMNGVGLLVPVATDQKAAPFRVLAEGRIAVDDFEMVTAGQAAAMAEHAGGTER
ncbi:MAG TPA: ABC transporter ATP-binding protein [Phycisphaerales bacterium]|nr:ABC transporter ATP-binding protein [Phycisphaerales bacterium]